MGGLRTLERKDLMDLTAELEVGTDWTEITGPLSMSSGQTYLVDVVQRADAGPDPVQVYWAETDDDTPPTLTGHAIKPGDAYVEFDQREITPSSGVRTWMRVSRGAVILTVTPT